MGDMAPSSGPLPAAGPPGGRPTRPELTEDTLLLASLHRMAHQLRALGARVAALEQRVDDSVAQLTCMVELAALTAPGAYRRPSVP